MQITYIFYFYIFLHIHQYLLAKNRIIFSLRLRTMFNVLDYQFSYLEILAKMIRPEKEIKGIQVRKKQIESFLFLGSIIIYI